MAIMERLEECDRMCRAITDARVSDAAQHDLTGLLHRDLMQFCVYLSLQDRNFTAAQRGYVRANLGYDLSYTDRTGLYDKVAVGYAEKLPTSMKYFILADAKGKIPNDPWQNKKTAYLIATYEALGREFLALSSGDPDQGAVQALTEYIRMLDKTIEGYGLFRNKNIKVTPGKSSSVKITPGKTPGKTAGSSSGTAVLTPGSSGAVSGGKPAAAVKPAAEKTGETNASDLSEDRIDEILAELNSLVGLDVVKEEIENLVNLLRVQQMRKELGLSNAGTSRHMVFYGNPGTGKTTVARLIAGIYGELGLLPTGQLVEVDRSGLVGGYVGQTAIKTKEVIDQAVGGVLFVDEAYTLTQNKGQNDFGPEAVETILKAMEDYRDELVVIVAGYTELMKDFLKTNPGLTSRFNYFIEFPDYTPEELVEILKTMCKKNEYNLSPAAEARALEIFTARCENKPENFANAREVRNFLEKAMLKHAARVTKLPKEERTREALTTLEAPDVEIKLR